MTKKNISIIGTVGIPACYGGFETLVENLVEEKCKEDITVYCSSKSYDKKLKTYKGAKLTYISLKANGPQSIIYDIVSLLCALFKRPDVILILGVSGCVILPFFRFFSRAKVVTNIDGLEWKRGKWGKWSKRFLKFSESVAVKYSDVIVADNNGIADYINQEYGVDSEVIAYGGDHAIVKALSISDEGYALALCRIEPENNVEIILESFSKTDKKLKFIGNWDNSEFGLAMKVKYQQFENIDIVPPIYDTEKLFEIRQKCSFYVHGHSAGGTNPSLVEMMHFGKPIFAFDCSYNRASTEDIAQFFESTDALIKLINSPVAVENASNMKEIAERRYTWKIVKQQYFNLFK